MSLHMQNHLDLVLCERECTGKYVKRNAHFTFFKDGFILTNHAGH